MEQFIAFKQILEPDSRNLHFVVENSTTGNQRSMTIGDVYHAVEGITLREEVPDDIRSQFNIAKNLAIYSWFSYFVSSNIR